MWGASLVLMRVLQVMAESIKHKKFVPLYAFMVLGVEKKLHSWRVK